jgi:hypothetical protein
MDNDPEERPPSNDIGVLRYRVAQLERRVDKEVKDIHEQVDRDLKDIREANDKRFSRVENFILAVLCLIATSVVGALITLVLKSPPSPP